MQMIILSGNVGKDAELRQTGNGDPVLNFSLAVDNGKDRDGQKRPATWYDCAIWGKRAEALRNHITKGSKLSISGRPTARAHEGKAYLGVNVDQLTFMGGGQERQQDDGYTGTAYDNSIGSGASSGHSEGYGRAPSRDIDDEIPFAPEVRM